MSCPLCRTSHATALESYRFDDIWRALEDQWDVSLSPEVRASHAPTTSTTALRCGACGLEWFDPAVPGDERFYHELMRSASYEANRWEFDIVADIVAGGDQVADLGCGDGYFVRRIAGSVQRSVGVDTNADAIGRLRADGYEGSDDDFATFAAREPGAFTVLCAFHVAEHIDDLALLLTPACALLRPGGRLFISVPNRDRLVRADLEPFDLPPHHLSRWAQPQLEALGRDRGLRLVRVLHSPPSYGDVTGTLQTRLAHRVPPRYARIGRRLLLGPTRHRLLARTGTYQRAGLMGHTMLAEFRVKR